MPDLVRFAFASFLCLPLFAGCTSTGGGGRFDGGGCDANPASCACIADSQCGGATPRCDKNTGTCVACLPENDACPPGHRCVATNGTFACSASCTIAADCAHTDGGAAPACCGGACVDTTSDSDNCGGCGHACGAVANGVTACKAGLCAIASCDMGFADCDGVVSNGCETPTMSNPNDCGACAHACAGANSTQACAGGRCMVTSCAAGFADCDMNPENGCEAPIATDPANCGGCGRSCPMAANATASCAAATCGFTCRMGYADCDKLPANGCEVQLTTDLTNCGACGNACPAVAHGVAGCNSGACGIASCSPGFADCDNKPSDGCEASLNTDVANCGACGAACNLANATSACSGGTCQLVSCQSGFGNCDGNAANGCEVPLTTNNNCGKCGNACGIGTNCNGGVCAAAPRVLIVGAEGSNGNYLVDLQTKLKAFPDFAGVDYFTADTATPSVAQLQLYGAVLVFSDYPFQDPITLGDNLATYWDAGGVVVIAAFADSAQVTNSLIAGRFGTIANGYILLGGGTVNEYPNDSMTIVDNTTPLTFNVKSITCLTCYRPNAAPVNGGQVVARWASNSRPMVVRGNVKGRNRVDLNFFPISSTVNANYWSGDAAQLLRNALLYK